MASKPHIVAPEGARSEFTPEGARIVVAGAGAIGCFVGGLLAAAGRNVTLLVRPRLEAEIRAHGLNLTDFSGMAVKVRVEDLELAEDPSVLGKADIVLVTVKSGSTVQIAKAIASHAPDHARIVSLQNGTENAAALRQALPGHDVRAGMVPFNVVPMGQGCFHRATSGDIAIGAGEQALAQTLSVPHLTVTESEEITAIQWGKFLINLGNAINALSGLTLQDMLRQRGWRCLMADQWAEALRVLKAHGIKPTSTTPLPVGLIPWVLRLPTPVFSRVAAQMLTIDAQARSSMAHDLMMGRKTEIDVLQGQVVRMGAEVGRKTPINARIQELVELSELAAEGLPNLPVKAIRSAE